MLSNTSKGGGGGHRRPAFASLLAPLLALVILCVYGVVAARSQLFNSESFAEELLIKPLLDGKVLNHFQFTTRISVNNTIEDHDNAFMHYRLFPKSLGQIIDKFAVQELHLTLTQGRWNYEKWGYPVIPAPVGAELYVWFDSAQVSSPDELNAKWKGLVHALSGLICASLNFLDTTKFSYATGVVSTPERTFYHEGRQNRLYNYNNNNNNNNNDRQDQGYFRYGTLSREIVCTENLTPFKKLLPSRGKSGIAELLNPLKLYDSNFHSMGIHFRPLHASSDDVSGVSMEQLHYELSQTVSVVFDLMLGKEKREYSDWSFDSLFNKHAVPLGGCNLAEVSTVYVELLPQFTRMKRDNVVAFDPQPTRTIGFEENGGSMLVYDLKQMAVSAAKREEDAAASEGRIATTTTTTSTSRQQRREPVQVSMTWRSPVPIPAEYNSQSMIVSHRYQTGFGHLEGGLVVRIDNNHPTESVNVTYFDAIPWYVRIYFHTIRATLNDVAIQPERDFIYFNAVPALERKAPSILEFSLSLPPLSTLIFSMEFDKAFLKYTEHPPDANRGFDLSSSIITYTIPTPKAPTGRAYNYEADSTYDLYHLGLEWSPVLNLQSLVDAKRYGSLPTRYYTESLIVSLPTPDFSMPYNVITLTCTVIALFFGSLYNVLIRRFGLAQKKKKQQQEEQQQQQNNETSITTTSTASATDEMIVVDEEDVRDESRRASRPLANLMQRTAVEAIRFIDGEEQDRS